MHEQVLEQQIRGRISEGVEGAGYQRQEKGKDIRRRKMGRISATEIQGNL